jgi:hypothetical protein
MTCAGLGVGLGGRAEIDLAVRREARRALKSVS